MNFYFQVTNVDGSKSETTYPQTSYLEMDPANNKVTVKFVSAQGNVMTVIKTFTQLTSFSLSK